MGAYGAKVAGRKMRTGRLLVIGAVLVSTFVCLANAASNTVASDKTLPRVFPKVEGDFAEYLEQTVSAVLNIEDPPHHESGFKTVRRLKTVVLLSVLEQVDKLRIPDFDFSKIPPWGVAPPLPYDSGISPSCIPDPAARRVYEDALRKNAEEKARYSFQLRTKSLDATLTPVITGYLSRAFERTPEDRNELMGYLNALLSTEARKTEMRKNLHELLDLPQERRE